MFFAKAAIALLMIGLTLHVRGTEASSSLTTETAKEASATFEMQSGGVRSSVVITVAETEVASPAGVERSLHADIEIFQADTRGGHNNRFIDVGGGVDTQSDGPVVIEDDLSKAALDVSIPVCGAKPLHNGRLKQRPSTECFDVQIALAWTSTTEIISDSGTDEYPAGDCTVQVLSSYRLNAASSIGTIIVGGINFAGSPSTRASLGTSNRSTIATCPD
jgi:hypothetical protein